MIIYSAALAFHRGNVGRGGELHNCNWKKCFYDVDENAMMGGWFQRKTGRISHMGHVRDKKDWTLDVIVMLAIMLIVGDEYKEGDSDMMFPFIHRLRCADASTYLNNAIKEARGHAQGLNPASTSHHARYGALSDIQHCKDLDFIDGIFRGKWFFQGECSGLSYANKAPGCLRAGKALAGWKECKNEIISLDAFELIDELMGDELMGDSTDAESKIMFRNKLDNFAGLLFKGLPYCQKKEEHLYKMRNIFLTAIIEMTPKIIADLKVFHNDDKYVDIFEKRLKHSLAMVQIDWSEFLKWSATVSNTSLCLLHATILLKKL